MGAQDGLRHPEQILLGLVRVDEHAALEVRGGAGDVGQAVAQEPARARFRHREREPALEEETPDHSLERLVVAPVAVLAEHFGGVALDAGQPVRRPRPSRDDPHPHLEVPAGRRQHGSRAGWRHVAAVGQARLPAGVAEEEEHVLGAVLELDGEPIPSTATGDEVAPLVVHPSQADDRQPLAVIGDRASDA